MPMTGKGALSNPPRAIFRQAYLASCSMKSRRLIKKVSAELEVLQFSAAVELHALKCPYCSLPLSLSQPDLTSPERLIGVCETCKHWFLIDILPARALGLVGKAFPTSI